MAEGITKRHSTGCPAKHGKACRCNAGYEAFVWSKRENKKTRKNFKTVAEAKAWRSEALSAAQRGHLRARSATTRAPSAWARFQLILAPGSTFRRSAVGGSATPHLSKPRS
jgi:hypothetical protein